MPVFKRSVSEVMFGLINWPFIRSANERVYSHTYAITAAHENNEAFISVKDPVELILLYSLDYNEISSACLLCGKTRWITKASSVPRSFSHSR